MDVLLWLVMFFTGVDRSKPPSPEVPALIKLLGDDEWKVREDARRKLEKMGPEIHKALEETIAKDKDLERRRRCERILPKVMNVYSDDKENYLPSIYYLPNTIRFPKGFDYSPQNYNDIDFKAEVDLGKIYFEKARKNYNNKARIGTAIRDDCWRDQWIEKDAMQLFMRDLRIKGVPAKTCTKILNWSVAFEKDYSLSYSSGEGLPPPARRSGNDYGYHNGCYQYIPTQPDGNWKNPHTVAKWVFKVKQWPTPESVMEQCKSLLDKAFPPETPQYQGHPGPCP